MKKYLDLLPKFMEEIRSIREIIIGNIIIMGEIPAPTFHERRRAEKMVERMVEFEVDECEIDDFGNPVAVIHGTSPERPSIFVVAHLDTFSSLTSTELHYEVSDKVISGIGVSDNSAAVGVLVSLPEILRRLSLRFDSDIVLVAPIHSLGKGNLRGIRRLLSKWRAPILGAICLETVELGRLNYFSDGMIRAEIDCRIPVEQQMRRHHLPNAILILNEVINSILCLRLPQRPRTQIVIGKIAGGINHGKIAYEAKLGFEIRSDSDELVQQLFRRIRDIVSGIEKVYTVELSLKRISNLNATQLSYSHPLIKCASKILAQLNVKTFSAPSESAQSIFLYRNIPAITLGLTQGNNFHEEGAMIEIDPLYKGISQIPALMMAMDNGECNE